jgi:drug/metabolite transporter (DMT)-like permease
MAAALVTTTAWGGQFIVGKSTFGHLDPVWLTALRYGVASLVFLGLLALVEGRAGFRRDPALGRVAVLGVVGFAGFNLRASYGLTTTSPEAASLIVSTMPLITAFVLWGRTGRRPATATWASSAVALLGVGLVLTDGHLGRLLHGGLAWGDLLVLAGAASWVVYTTGAASVPHWSPLRYTALSAAFGSAAIVALALGGSAAGRVLGAQDAVLFINVVPLTAFAIEAVRGNAPHAAELAGVAVTVGALVVSNLLGRRTARVGRVACCPVEAAAGPAGKTP